MATLSEMQVPSSSSRTGTPPMGFFARNGGWRFSALAMSTFTRGTWMPFSARNIRTRRGFGASLLSWSFTGDPPAGTVSQEERDAASRLVGREVRRRGLGGVLDQAGDLDRLLVLLLLHELGAAALPALGEALHVLLRARFPELVAAVVGHLRHVLVTGDLLGEALALPVHLAGRQHARLRAGGEGSEDEHDEAEAPAHE